MAVAAAGHEFAHPRFQPFRPEAAGRTAVARTIGPGRAVHVREWQRRPHHLLLLEGARPQQMPFRYFQSDNVAAIRWVEGGYTYVVSGNADKTRLKELARAAYEQLENRAPPPPANRSSTEPGPQGHVTRHGEASGETLARIVGRAVAQLAHQFFELAVGRLRQARCARSRADRPCRSLSGKPLPFSRKVRPPLVLAGMASSTAPSSVGTRTLPPSTAS